jgi:hypothetical protein
VHYKLDCLCSAYISKFPTSFYSSNIVNVDASVAHIAALMMDGQMKSVVGLPIEFKVYSEEHTLLP